MDSGKNPICKSVFKTNGDKETLTEVYTDLWAKLINHLENARTVVTK